MKLRILIASVLSLTAVGFWPSPERAAASRRAASSEPEGLVVHEWGTFLAMNGSDGVSLDGMYHEEHALPSFVHARSKDQLHLPMSLLKGETPVIYFYTPRPANVEVEVGFPTGLWTQWYPQASMVAPGLVQAGAPPHARNGRIVWTAQLLPADAAHIPLAETSADALWNYARDVDAAYVSTKNYVSPSAPPTGVSEWERFIFYRGLGQAPLPIEVRSAAGRITATTSEPDGLRHLFVVRIENGRGVYSYAPALTTRDALNQAIPTMDGALPLDQFVERVSNDVATRLTQSGLYAKEARAMVNTWKSSYFKTDGVRLLFVLPQSWTDRFIPMRIKPAPTQLVRVMVGRVELLDDAHEHRAESAISSLASPDAAVREKAFETLRAEGRYVEPIVRRTLRTTTDERVRALANRLLLTDFVTELRTAFTNAVGERQDTQAVFIQAQLASLLRQMGLTAEARQEGDAALAQLSHMPQPTMNAHESRHMFRALARANEGAGRDAEALTWYGKFVEFGSQFQQPKMCTGCHTTMGPRDWSFFKDWYAGEKFGEYAVKTGEAPRLIAAHESSRSLASQLSLAYLYAATGQTEKATGVWTMLNR